MIKSVGVDPEKRKVYEDKLEKERKAKEEAERREREERERKEKNIKTVTCPTCGEIISFSELDEREEYGRIDFYNSGVVRKFIHCPQCKKEVETYRD